MHVSDCQRPTKQTTTQCEAHQCVWWLWDCIRVHGCTLGEALEQLVIILLYFILLCFMLCYVVLFCYYFIVCYFYCLA
jgi:hypothetical protein